MSATNAKHDQTLLTVFIGGSTIPGIQELYVYIYVHMPY